MDGGDSQVERIDAATGAVTRTVAVGSDPTSIAATPDGNALWIVNTGSGTVFRIATETATVTAAQQVGDRPTGVVVEQEAVWVAVSSTNEIVRLDLDTAQIVGRTPLPGDAAGADRRGWARRIHRQRAGRKPSRRCAPGRDGSRRGSRVAQSDLLAVGR